MIKSSLEFNWRLQLESNSVMTQFDYMIDCNGNKPFFTVRNLIEPFNHMTQMFPLKIQIQNLSHDTDEVIEWQIGQYFFLIFTLYYNYKKRRQSKRMGNMREDEGDALVGEWHNERGPR